MAPQRLQDGSKGQYHPYRADDDGPCPKREEIRRGALDRSRERHRLREKEDWDPFCDLARDPFNMRYARGTKENPVELKRESPALQVLLDERSASAAGTSAGRSAERAAATQSATDDGGKSRAKTQKTTIATRTGNHSLSRTLKYQGGGGAESAKLRAEIALMKSRIQSLERSENRLKQQVRDKAETVKDMKVEVERARNEALQAEEKREEIKEQVRDLQHNLEKYRGWWLTDYYSLKVVLQLVPNKDDVRDIAFSSKARFRTHSELQ